MNFDITDLTDPILDMSTSIMTVPSQRHSFIIPAQPLPKGSEEKTTMVGLRHPQGERLTDKSECDRQEYRFYD